MIVLEKQKLGSIPYRRGSQWDVPASAPSAGQVPIWGSSNTLDWGFIGAANITNRTRTIAVATAGEVGNDKEWIVLAGAPDFAQRNSLYGAIAFDADAVESMQWLRSMVVTQDYVSGIEATLVWTNLGAGTGDVRWRIGYSVGSDGTAFAALSTADNTVTAPAQNVLKYSTSSLAPTVAAGSILNFSVGRLATNAADTLANDSGFVALIITITADS